METLNRRLLEMTKRSFMSADQLEQGAGGGMPPEGMPPEGMPPEGMPMDPGMMEGGMPPEGMPMDPGMMPPPGMDPAMAGMVGGGTPPEMMEAPPSPPSGGPSQITLTIDELIKFVKLFRGAPVEEETASAASPAGVDENTLRTILDAIGRTGG